MRCADTAEVERKKVPFSNRFAAGAAELTPRCGCPILVYSCAEDGIVTLPSRSASPKA